jgi:hypothetical protein
MKKILAGLLVLGLSGCTLNYLGELLGGKPRDAADDNPASLNSYRLMYFDPAHPDMGEKSPIFDCASHLRCAEANFSECSTEIERAAYQKCFDEKGKERMRTDVSGQVWYYAWNYSADTGLCECTILPKSNN